MKRPVLVSAISALLLAVTVFAADEIKLDGVKCVVNAKGAAKADNAVDYKGAQVFFCCKNCPKAFEKDTAKFAHKANAQLVQTKQAEQVKCPLSGRDLDEKQTTEVAGVKVVFCCPNCKGKVAEAEGDDQLMLVFSDKAFEKGFEVKKDEESEEKAQH